MTSIQKTFDTVYTELKEVGSSYLDWSEDVYTNVSSRQTAERIADLFRTLGYDVYYEYYGKCHPKEGQVCCIRIKV